MKVLLIVPAYNEEESILQVVRMVRKTGYDFVVINDGSSDHTAELCRENGCTLINHGVNLGLTAGIQTGARYAVANDYDAIIQFDADGQHRPEYISGMVEEMERTGSDIVIGSRFVTEKKPVSARMVGSRMLTGIIRMTTGTTISDPTSGMRLYGRRAMKELATRSDFGPEPDTIAYLLRHGFTVSEVQVHMSERQAGESYLSPSKSAAYMARMFVSILFVQWFRD
jgi:glycosyltransferase involved in cell wall biosynthesis